MDECGVKRRTATPAITTYQQPPDMLIPIARLELAHASLHQHVSQFCTTASSHLFPCNTDSIDGRSLPHVDCSCRANPSVRTKLGSFAHIARRHEMALLHSIALLTRAECMAVRGTQHDKWQNRLQKSRCRLLLLCSEHQKVLL